MRSILLVFAILLAGCITPEAARNDSNQSVLPTPQIPAPEAQVSQPIPETSGNISALPDETIPKNETPESPPINETPQNPMPETQTPPEGLAFGSNRYIIALDDVSLVPTSAEPCGIFSLRMADGSLIEKMFICPGQSEMWDGPDGGSYRILVVKVAGGYTGHKWAQVIVYG
jgi:hypothetical protein